MYEKIRFLVRSRTCLALLAAALVWPAAGSHAAEAPAMAAPAGAPSVAQAPLKRPKIGLVLSGGGARGAAHVGVLKVLEEMRIPIDFIAGTSMGSIVGAAYASGLSISEMEKVLTKLDTATLLVDSPSRTDQPMRRKRDDLAPYIGPELGIRGGSLRLPRGAVSGIALEAVLRTLVTAPAVNEFDRLPIPFRAVATDIETGEAVILSKGDLANAMRASMAVPGLVAPAQIDGRLLIDGGITRNLPVDVVRAMGADIVIAVNLGTPLLRRDQISSLLSVSVQMIGILTEQNVRTSLAQLRSDDVLIVPELGDYSAGDFDNMAKTVPIGEAAARKVMAQLALLGLPVADFAALRAAQARTAVADLRPIDEIRVEGVSRVNPEVVINSLQTRIGKPIDQPTLDADLRRIYGRGDFEHAGYSLIDEPGRRVLSIRAPEKSWGPDYLRFGLGLSSEFNGESNFNLLASYRRQWINSLGAEWRTDLQAGRDNRLSSELYLPLTVSQHFVIAPRVEVARRPLPIYNGNQRVGRFDEISRRVALDLGSQFNKYGEARIGIMRGDKQFSQDTGTFVIPAGQGDFSEGALTARLLFDQLDSVRFTRSGYSAAANLFSSRTMLGADAAYDRYDLDALGARSWGPHTLQVGLRSSGAVGTSPLPTNDLVQWGGFQQQSGYRSNQLLGQSLNYGKIVYLNQLIKRGLFEGAYVGGSIEVGRVGGPVMPASNGGMLLSGSIFIAMDTPLGPIYLAYGQSRDGNSSAYIYLGRP